MDPVTVIISALSAGAILALQDTAGKAVKDSYEGLVQLVNRKFSKNPKAKTALNNHKKKPQASRKNLKKALEETKATEDKEILIAAEKLLELISKHNSSISNDLVINGDAQGVIKENWGEVTMNFNQPAKKSSRKKT